MKIGLLHTTIRGDEKLLIEVAKKKKVHLEIIDVRDLILNPKKNPHVCTVYLERCVSTVKGIYAIRYFENLGLKVVNSSAVADICSDKFLTSLALFKNNVSTPKFAMAFDTKTAVEAIDAIGGFPVILKPAQGSWGRLLAKINLMYLNSHFEIFMQAFILQ